jgi:hypothetical protein
MWGSTSITPMPGRDVVSVADALAEWAPAAQTVR